MRRFGYTKAERLPAACHGQRWPVLELPTAVQRPFRYRATTLLRWADYAVVAGQQLRYLAVTIDARAHPSTMQPTQ